MFLKSTLTGLVCAYGLLASGGKSGGPSPAPAPNTAEVRISNEITPAGGTTQVKFSLTNPQPILSGGTSFSGFAANGVSLWSPLGDTAGSAVFNNGQFQISAVSPQGDLGTATDYPILTVTMTLPPTLAVGSTFPLDLANFSFLSPTGTIAVTTKPGTLTVGGSFWIQNVLPGGGTYPAGTTVRVLGQGFLPNAQLKTPQIKFSSWRVVDSTEIDFVLKEQTTMDAQAIQVTSGNLTQTYYSYLRGVLLSQPSKVLLQNTDPIFQQQTHALAAITALDAPTATQYTALALQNPNPGPAVATLTLTHSDGSAETNAIVLPSGARVMDEIGALVLSTGVRNGDQLNLVSTAPIQILGLNADESLWTAQPFLPSF